MFNNIKVLVVDDEENITKFVAYALEREFYMVETAYDGIEALDKIKSFKPNIIILDVMMPNLNGYEVCEEIKCSSIGIIMLTAKNNLLDKIVGLDLGADDYLTKPFEMIELLARVKSLSRRIMNSSEIINAIKIETFEIDIDSRNVYIDNELIEFKPREFDLLEFLFINIDMVFSRDYILSKVWGYDYLGGTRTIDIHVQRIRNKLGRYGKLIKTVQRIGYKAISKFE